MKVLLRCANTLLDLERPVVMGVLNVTPDSFSDGGRFSTSAEAVEHALRMVQEGAAIIDVGGESTRPGAAPVSAEEQLRRVLPVIEGLEGRTAAVISIDTSDPQVIRRAAAAGAGMINDVRALTAPLALEAAAETTCAVCLTHMLGDPRTMQDRPTYVNVVKEVEAFLVSRARSCAAAGIGADRMVIDPGFGFGKTLEHNLELLRHLRDLAQTGAPVLVALSRKSMVGKLTGRAAPERIYGSVALAAIAVMNGARIVRAHDVAATADAVKAAAAVMGG